MAIQQMALMAYRAPPAGGADSAYLQAVNESSSINFVEIKFNPTGSPGTVITSPSSTSYTWKTGPNAQSAYEVKYIEDVAGGAGADGADTVNTWHGLNLSDFPIFRVNLGIGNSSDGFLVIRNASTLEELANVTVAMVADPNV